ncbi:hypothetical protein TREMEDRAFT_28893 [Tremella mesenterica DSM 1558]|uniref:uncharacterized protein n=1 Tax=Tremella mesenterica (strain ATCC 24925 / CBS 8224 / DSM 1558 / NBRC 9311 / NRRL Y-6157 / RJB 2259-6 / UBC 559-6) TaxID=578456 RepID=UPI0003F49026|nr:uncharacterized protein TREMEDRAFT_28893 [Tremella mesenterica DSM 1558]EIW70623.1 hypothetical protein TREMEDRAFT_28893 [Tremella mesenterica DSM 1558]
MRFKIALTLPVLTIFALPTRALWPFKQKRFVAEAFIDAGPLGLEDATGRVIAMGDWNGDQHSDLFILSKDQKSVQLYLWNRESFKFLPSHSVTLSSNIINVVPGDYNHDGQLDLLVMYEDKSDGGWWGGDKIRLGMQVYIGGGVDGGFQTDPWAIPSSTMAQPLVFDADGSLRPSLLGFQEDEAGDNLVKVWKNTGSGFTLLAPPLQTPEEACVPASLHSSAFLDIDGDCLPDIILHCTQPHTSHHSIQIWLNHGEAGFALARTYDLPKGSGPLSFADMNRDGSIDIIFPTCSGHSSSTGLGSDCSINIAYNQQVPICSTERSQNTKDGSLKCRGWGELCTRDENFSFSFDSSSETQSMLSVPLSTLLENSIGDGDLLLHPPHARSIPLPIRPGDFNVNGFPDLLITIANSTAAPPTGGPFGSSRHAGHQVKILENVPCGKGVAGCEKGSKRKRGLRVGSGKGWTALDGIWDASGASWMDLDDDGSLDILVQRTNAQGEGLVTVVQNNFYHDAFFLKAQVLNGACQGECETIEARKYSPLGVSYGGATFKFTVQDTLGRRVAQQVAQLPQTGYHALGTPYAFFGLGRTNNYVERLTVGTSLHPPGHTTDLESLIPNSQIIINPPFPDTGDSESPGKVRSTEWRSELYLHPGDWVPWVGAAVIGTVIILAIVVFGLNEREKKEDEKERRRALHAINFQAL